MNVQRIKYLVGKNKPTILTFVGVGGVAGTIYLATKAGTKAERILNEASGEEPLTKREVVKLTWKVYAPVVILGGLSVTALLQAHNIHVKRNAALASAYAITERTLATYKDKVFETVGEKKANVIKDKVAEEKTRRVLKDDSQIIITGHGDVLCFDSVSGRYFRSNHDKLRRVENEINHRLLSEMWIALNEFYYEIGLEAISIGGELGWDINESGMLSIDYTSLLTEDGTPCLSLDYLVRPRYHAF